MICPVNTMRLSNYINLLGQMAVHCEKYIKFKIPGKMP